MDYLERNFRNIRDETFAEMLSGRGGKYRSFLFCLRSVKHMPGLKARGNLLEAYYVFMRQIDDIADRDGKFSPPFPEEFIERKIEFANNPVNPQDSLDHLLLYCYSQCESLGFDFRQETNDILSSMLFDARRHGKMQVFPNSVLYHHFDLLDIRGCVKACLKLYDEDPDKFDLVKPLGLASRIYYNLRDFGEDVGKGFVNITNEDMESLGISVDDLKNPNCEGVREWFYDQSMKGLSLLHGHNRIIGQGEFGLLARITFPLVYARPARKYFERVLKGSD
jgi:hypothetical protein